MRMVLKAVLVFAAFSVAAQTPVRLSWQEFARDPNRVQSFRNAVATMKSRNGADRTTATYRKSWEYWANIHGYFGPSAKGGTVATWRTNNKLTDPSWDPYFDGVQNMSPPDAIAQRVWDQCAHGTDYFFAWHRLFLYRFERVLQEAAGDPNLRLPYWDYSDTSYLEMPKEFREPTYVNAQGQTVANPLYDKRRLPGWENNTRKLPAKDTDIDLALQKPDLLGSTGYQFAIERGPHANVHCDVMQCRATVMGAVPYSPNDPIFWVHHCNIDRMWECWLSISGHRNPDSIMGQTFTFVDTNGNPVTNAVRELFNGSLIDYVYQQSSNCQRPRMNAAPMAAAAMSTKTVTAARKALSKPVVIADDEDDVPFTAQTTRTRVTLPATASLSHPRQFALRAVPELPVVTELVLRNVHFAQHPRTSFRVFLARPDRPEQRALVGTMSFFADEPEGDAHHHVADDRTFDATDALHELGLEGTGALDVDVIFEAVDESILPGPDFDPEASKVVVDEIEFVIQRER
ncbi:MAG TPA: tyrosinase family protein [Thermoanaerobaculia bacterium]|nr:tyrosinase family protein [Thermoanaerobaculia bacterium]